MEELVKSGEIDITSKYESLQAGKIPGDFRFVERITISYHRLLKLLGISEKRDFGLDPSFVSIEQVPLIADIPEPIQMKRIK